MPMAHDQFDNAARVTRLGAGASIRRRTYRGKAVAAALGRLLNDPAVDSQCKRVAAHFVGTKPLAETCDQIEMFALTTPPTTRRATAPPPAGTQNDVEVIQEPPRPRRPERPPQPGMS
jgi:hypothetical protein